MKSQFKLVLDKEEAHALLEAYIRGLNNEKRSSPAEMRMTEKLTKLGNELEDAR